MRYSWRPSADAILANMDEAPTIEPDASIVQNLAAIAAGAVL